MRVYLSLLLLFFTSLPNQLFAVTDDEVAEITERVEAYSTDELVERKNMLEESLEVDEADEEDCAGDVNGNSVYSPDGKCVKARTILLELSIIEQLLILAGVIVADNISDEKKAIRIQIVKDFYNTSCLVSDCLGIKLVDSM